MTQTQPEPSMYVKINADSKDCVVGYLVVIAFVDDVRYFGTQPEVEKYKQDVLSRLKVKFEKPPVQEFVSIETYQNLEEGTFELKMPKYFIKATQFFKDFRFRKGEFKKRTIPLSVLDKNVYLNNQHLKKLLKQKIYHFSRQLAFYPIQLRIANSKCVMQYLSLGLGD